MGKKLSESLNAMMEGLTQKQLLLMAGVAGLLTFVVLYIALSNLTPSDPAPVAPKVATTAVVVAKQDIQAREYIRESTLQVIQLPKDAIPPGAVTDISTVIRKPAKVAIMAGDVVTEKKVYLDIKQAGFTGMIPPDCRAVSIAVNDVTGVAGFARPGDYVDVLLVSDKLDNNKFTGEIFLQNVLLLGINKAVEAPDGSSGGGDKDKKDDKSAKAGEAPVTATLAVKPEDTLKLTVAAQSGQVYLALRPFKPSNTLTLDTDFFLLKGSAKAAATQPPPSAPGYAPPVPAAPAAPAEPETGASNIEVYRGTKASKGK
ncbi:MAG: Flp pilus assembly protein CpaB [Schwartzia sp.]|nr:Flp pilus assembly protein CpaB [Schwartzia sp. (in: firmicutes)]